MPYWIFPIGCVENELGLRQFLESRGHEYVVTDSKDGEGNELDKHLPDTDIVSLFLLFRSQTLLMTPDCCALYLSQGNTNTSH